ncbi:MAG: hypothetical protein BMS9Abin05_1802 [Rhodothermia bacterium]|nr:MAG: hypothetical protein BMS9Abin05_1802 [Rhodothermia bacterium]
MHAVVRHFLIIAIAAAVLRPATAQRLESGNAGTYLGGGVGFFTYHGPIDLLGPENGSNFVRESGPAAIIRGSFPVLRRWVYFRFMLLVTNFDTSSGKRLVGNGENEFLTKTLLIFEPEIVLNFASLGNGRATPYIFTGFGGTVADLFDGDRGLIDFPGTGIPGPERSVFHIPVGFGVDVPVSDAYTFYAEASWRFDFNYAFRNEPNYDAHSTSLLTAGMKVCLNCKRDVPVSFPVPPEYPEIDIPDRDIPPFSELRGCSLPELNPITFPEGSAILTEEAIARLDENVVALRSTSNCCIHITGYAGGKDTVAAKLLATDRALVVRHYYEAGGLSESRMSHSGEWISEKCRTKSDHSGDNCLLRNAATTKPGNCIELPQRNDK